MNDIYELHPRPWREGHSTSDGFPIWDADGELVMMVNATQSAIEGDIVSRRLMKAIVATANACNGVPVGMLCRVAESGGFKDFSGAIDVEVTRWEMEQE